MWLSVGLGVSTVGFCVAWLRVRERWLRCDERLRNSVPSVAEAHLVNAIDSVAIEVERIGESQRFLHELLAAKPTIQRPAITGDSIL